MQEIPPSLPVDVDKKQRIAGGMAYAKSIFGMRAGSGVGIRDLRKTMESGTGGRRLRCRALRDIHIP